VPTPQNTPSQIDALVSPTLKYLRERWWNPEFSEFLSETLRPRPGTRILDVGCGEGTAELSLGRLQISQVDLFAIDRRLERVLQAKRTAAAHNIRVKAAAADACHLPFRSDVFDSTFCVAVLQHVREVDVAIGELARVTKPGGHIVAVEPDNAARYWFSSLESGRKAFELGSTFFAAVLAARGDATDPSVGPKLTSFFAKAGIEPVAVNLFPVSLVRLEPPPKAVWQERQDGARRLLTGIDDGRVRTLADEYAAQLDRYASDVTAAGSSFVEIQNTMLFAAVGHKPE
jgi:ubiquinone/menaquinone biosynthesis C-methylase UbiE